MLYIALSVVLLAGVVVWGVITLRRSLEYLRAEVWRGADAIERIVIEPVGQVAVAADVPVTMCISPDEVRWAEREE